MLVFHSSPPPGGVLVSLLGDEEKANTSEKYDQWRHCRNDQSIVEIRRKQAGTGQYGSNIEVHKHHPLEKGLVRVGVHSSGDVSELQMETIRERIQGVGGSITRLEVHFIGHRGDIVFVACGQGHDDILHNKFNHTIARSIQYHILLGNLTTSLNISKVLALG